MAELPAALCRWVAYVEIFTGLCSHFVLVCYSYIKKENLVAGCVAEGAKLLWYNVRFLYRGEVKVMFSVTFCK